MGNDEQLVVVGAGPVGCVLAAILAKRGEQVVLYERRSDMRLGEAGGGRSINLVLTRRGLRALDLLGLEQEVLKLTVPVLGRMMHALDGQLTYQPYGKDDSECNHSVSRGQLNIFLLDKAEEAGVKIVFDHQLEEVDFESGTLTFTQGQDGPRVEVKAGCVIGCDGAPSAVRRSLVARGTCTASEDMLEHGYKELTFPAGADGGYAMEKTALHIWPRGHHFLMGLPNLDGSFTGTVYLPWKGEDGFEALNTQEKALAFFERAYPDSLPLLPDAGTEFLANPTGHLGTVRCAPWHLDGRALLVGDAAHAIVPFFGQGLNCGFEDCAVLNELLDQGLPRAEVFARFDALRKANADAIADMALENFVEMRDKVGDPGFLLKKAIGSRIEKAMPHKYRSRYAMVMYSSIPYAVAFQAGVIQSALIAELAEGVTDAEQVDLARAEALIDERLTPFFAEHDVDLGF